MNAQEAMKYIDKEIRRLSKGIEYKVPSERAMLEDYIEAFSIVLESAKRLEKISDEALSYSGIEDLDVNNVELFNFSKWVYNVSEGFDVSE